MKTILFSALLLLASVISFSQQPEFTVLYNPKTVGRNFTTSQDIRATEYVFAEKIFRTYVDTLSGNMTVLLRGMTPNGLWLVA
jgi:hypothetical protein